MIETFEIDLSQLRPSQLYICAEKRAAMEQTSSGDGGDVEPVPLKVLDGRTVLTDGHTRAVAAYRADRESISAYGDGDDLDWDAYRVGVRWCLDRGVRSLANLATRIVTADQYEGMWLRRCRELHERLARERKPRTTSENR
jgi:hypothetical protein